MARSFSSFFTGWPSLRLCENRKELLIVAQLLLLFVLVPWVVFWVHVFDFPRAHAVKLNYRFSLDPLKMLHASLPSAHFALSGYNEWPNTSLLVNPNPIIHIPQFKEIQ